MGTKVVLFPVAKSSRGPFVFIARPKTLHPSISFAAVSAASWDIKLTKPHCFDLPEASLSITIFFIGPNLWKKLWSICSFTSTDNPPTHTGKAAIFYSIFADPSDVLELIRGFFFMLRMHEMTYLWSHSEIWVQHCNCVGLPGPRRGLGEAGTFLIWG